MKYGYARVSTFGQSLDAQIVILKKEKCDKIYSEKFTGTSLNRPTFTYLLRILKAKDTLVVTKLDRMARNTHEALQVIRRLFERNVRVHILNMGIIEDTPTGRLVFTIFSAFAEYERDMILSRTQEGKYLAKLNNPNYREGRPPTYSIEQRKQALQLLKTHTYKQVVQETGISLSTLKRFMSKLPEADRQALNRARKLSRNQ